MARPRPLRFRHSVYIGTSGWMYAHWKDSFYQGAPQKDWLKIASQKFTGLEVNATFYHLLNRSTFERWYSETPPEFRFAIKGNRWVTHRKRLIDVEDAILRERERAEGLGEKLAVVLWQMPRGLKKDLPRLEDFLGLLEKNWSSVRHAVEFRHKSWFDEETAEVLADRKVANVISDAKDWPLWDAVTTDLAYVRLHGHERTYYSAYSSEDLREWAGKVKQWVGENRSVHVYFDNDAGGYAQVNALELLDKVRRSLRRKGS
ncbi:MAG: DUF72 domain-containing protein [Fimbriimonadales bacterium]|nr:DUF72 domain-containing protein [Fimbriimonadales bacterium]